MVRYKGVNVILIYNSESSTVHDILYYNFGPTLLEVVVGGGGQ